MAFKIIVNVFYEPGAFLTSMMSQDGGRAYCAINGGSSLKTKAGLYPWLKYDDTGDQISSHNSLLNEMTSVYWFWKNYPLDSLDYVGFNHYRRFFDPADFNDYGKYDIVVSCPYKWRFAGDVKNQYETFHVGKDLQYLTGLFEVVNLSGDFHEFLKLTYLFAPCNMFLMKTGLFREYCEFMFPLLFKLEQYVKADGRNKYQRRAIAFLSERMTSFWMFQKKKLGLGVKEIPIKFIV